MDKGFFVGVPYGTITGKDGSMEMRLETGPEFEMVPFKEQEVIIYYNAQDFNQLHSIQLSSDRGDKIIFKITQDATKEIKWSAQIHEMNFIEKHLKEDDLNNRAMATKIEILEILT